MTRCKMEKKWSLLLMQNGCVTVIDICMAQNRFVSLCAHVLHVRLREDQPSA